MATYAIGDIHGCLRTVDDLLARIRFSPSDSLWLTGDLVGRGTDSLGVLRWAYEHRECVKMVLGNHDLHLLAAHAGMRSAGDDSLSAVLRAPDTDELCQWLRAQPLMFRENGYALLHAGRMPEWDEEQAMTLAAEASVRIRDDDNFLGAMYGDSPARWDSELSGDSRHRLIVNAFTRMRLLTADGDIVPGYAGEPQNRPPKTVPWFDFPRRVQWSETVICGHWSTLGLVMRHDLAALDTGCLWGGSLTAMRLEDRAVFQVPVHSGESITPRTRDSVK